MTFRNRSVSTTVAAARAGQRGVVLFIALIVMAALALTAIALVRSVDTTTTVVGNLGFREASISPTNRAVEEAVAALFETGAIADTTVNNVGQNYYATLQAGEDSRGIPLALQKVANYPATARKIDDGNGNTIRWIVERACIATGTAIAATCDMMAPKQSLGTTTTETTPVALPRVPFYRLTVRVDGPANTVSFAQAMLR
jgi:cellulase/cellobiase CelA1